MAEGIGARLTRGEDVALDAYVTERGSIVERLAQPGASLDPESAELIARALTLDPDILVSLDARLDSIRAGLRSLGESRRSLETYRGSPGGVPCFIERLG